MPPAPGNHGRGSLVAEHVRAFIAVLPPEEVADELESFLSPRRDALAGRRQWRWTRPEHWHLTLAFLPELEEWREEALISDGEVWSSRHSGVELALRGAGAFPDPASARVLWAAVAGGEALAPWAKELRALASRAGAEVEGTRFHPHLTVARAAGGRHAAGHLVQALDTLVTGGWTVSEVVLVGSHLGQGPGGTPRYEVRHRWRLGA